MCVTRSCIRPGGRNEPFIAKMKRESVFSGWEVSQPAGCSCHKSIAVKMNKLVSCPVRSLVTGLGIAILSQSAIVAADTSAIVAVSGAYNARDVVTNQSISGGFTVANGNVHSWANDFSSNVGYQIGNIGTGVVMTIGQPSFPINSNGYGDAFGLYDASTGSFYAGTYGNTNGGIYRYASGGWTALGTFNSLYGGEAHGGQVYASGLNAIWTGGVGQDNQIALYDMTGGDNHDVLIQATGNSAYVAVDGAGNVYYANYNGAKPALYRWSFEDINLVRADQGGGLAGGGIDDLYLTYDDAQLLTYLSDGANGIAVDEGGNVFVTINGSASSLVMWNESMGFSTEGSLTDYHYTTIATLDPFAFTGWFGALDTSGNFLNGGAVYLSNFGSAGVAEITQAVPEPSTWALMLTCAAGWFFWQRRKAARRLA